MKFILYYLRSDYMNREEKIQALRDIIKIKSVNGDELLVAQYLMNMLKGENIKTELIQYDKNRASLVAEFSDFRQ